MNPLRIEVLQQLYGVAECNVDQEAASDNCVGVFADIISIAVGTGMTNLWFRHDRDELLLDTYCGFQIGNKFEWWDVPAASASCWLGFFRLALTGTHFENYWPPWGAMPVNCNNRIHELTVGIVNLDEIVINWDIAEFRKDYGHIPDLMKDDVRKNLNLKSVEFPSD